MYGHVQGVRVDEYGQLCCVSLAFLYLCPYSRDMLDDRTEFRNAAEEKSLWSLAARKAGKKLARWMRETLTQAASRQISPPTDAR